MLDETPTNFTLFTEQTDGKIELDAESGCPTMRISVEDLASKTLDFLGDIIGDDLARLVADYNGNIDCAREQHQYVLDVNKDNEALRVKLGELEHLEAQNNELRTKAGELLRENDNAKRALAVQKTAINKALNTLNEEARKAKLAEAQANKALQAQKKAESELESIKKKLAEQKKKTALAEGQVNAKEERIKWYKRKLRDITLQLAKVGDHAGEVARTCDYATKVMKATGRVVEASISVPIGEVKLARIPLNIGGTHNAINIRLAAMGENVSLRHNYAYVIDDGRTGQQYVYAGENGGFTSFSVPTFTKYKAVKDYITKQFESETTYDFDTLQAEDETLGKPIKELQECVQNTVKVITELAEKADPMDGKRGPVVLASKK